MLTPPALMLLIAGLAPAATGPTLAWHVAGVCVAAAALCLIAMASGLRRSAAADEAARREAVLDAAILATAGACGSQCPTRACGGQDCPVRAPRHG